jgi:hypothetical protein
MFEKKLDVKTILETTLLVMIYVCLTVGLVYALSVVAPSGLTGFTWGNFTAISCTDLYADTVYLNNADVTALNATTHIATSLEADYAEILDLLVMKSAVKAYGLDAGSQSITNNTNVNIPFDAGEEFDYVHEFDGDVFTATSTGYYYVSAQISIEGSATEYPCTLEIIDQSTTSRLKAIEIIGDGEYNTVSVSGLVQLSAGNTLRARVYQTSDSAKSLSSGMSRHYISIIQTLAKPS